MIRNIALGSVTCLGAYVTWDKFYYKVEAKTTTKNTGLGSLGTPTGPFNSSKVKDVSGLKLIHVDIFFRHGARTPIRVFPGLEEIAYDENIHGVVPAHTNVPFDVQDLDSGGPRPASRMDDRQLNTFLKGGMPAGQLTTLGREQAYQLGLRLRKKYIEELNFISSMFDQKEVFVRSTNINRCINTLRCVVAGVFGAEQFHQNAPLIIPVQHFLHEMLYPNLTSCDALRHVIASNPDILMAIPAYQSVVSKVQEHFGNDTTIYIDVMTLRDNIFAAKAHGMKENVPDWLLKLEDEIDGAALIGVDHFVCGDEKHKPALLKLVSGRMYEMIEKNMRRAMADKNSIEKMHLYSCHDTSVYPLLAALHYPFTEWPPYTADVRYELYENEQKQHFVRIMYCGEDYIPPTCDGPLIPFDKFHKLIELVILTPDEYRQGCHDIDIAKEMAALSGAAEKLKAVGDAPPMM